MGAHEPATFLYLGQPGESALKSDRASSRSKTLRAKKNLRSKYDDGLIGGPATAVSPNRKVRVFDNNSYAIVKRSLKSSPKMVNMIQEVYDSGRPVNVKDIIKKRK